ncbi:MAG: phasin family protein [Alphaproteobacteria bacterium]
MSETVQTRISRAGRAAANAAEEATEAVTTLRTEIPSSLVDLFEKSVARAKDAHAKVASVMEHSTEAFEEAFSCASRGQAEYRAKMMEIGRANANLAFDLARDLCEAKTVGDFFESAIAHQRRQFDTAAAQMKELSALTQRVVSETTEPIRTGMTEPFRLAS